jgi:hypothetical protein
MEVLGSNEGSVARYVERSVSEKSNQSNATKMTMIEIDGKGQHQSVRSCVALSSVVLQCRCDRPRYIDPDPAQEINCIPPNPIRYHPVYSKQTASQVTQHGLEAKLSRGETPRPVKKIK